MKKILNFDSFNESINSDMILFRLVSGGLKDSISSHGPVTKGLIPSATKRICGQVEGYIDEQIKKKLESEYSEDYIVLPKEKYEQMKISIERKNKSIKDLVSKLKESGQL